MITSPNRMHPARLSFKSLLDILISLFLQIVLSPVVLITAFLIKLDSREPVIYSQTRMGRNGKEFQLHNLRSMSEGAEKDSAPWRGRARRSAPPCACGAVSAPGTRRTFR